MNLNRDVLFEMMEKEYSGNFSEFSRELDVDVSHLYKFLTKGVGVHKEKLSSFELALRDAGVAPFNIVRVSSIYPPYCKWISKEAGLKYLTPGQVLFTVIA